MSNSFIVFLGNLKKKEVSSWEKLYSIAKIMIEHYAESENIELDWAADDLGLVALYPDWFDKLFERFKNNFPIFEGQIKEFQDFKNLFLKLVRSELENLFAHFTSLLIKNDNKAWSLLNKALQKKLFIWITKHGLNEPESAQYIYFEGLSVLLEKIISGKAQFENSSKLKSYFIKILENKIKEHRRKLSKQMNYFEIEQYQSLRGHEFAIIQEPEEDQNLIRLVQKQISELETDEREIIIRFFYYKEKLNEIAVNLSISEENCRVIKFRVLKKLKIRMKNINFEYTL